MPALRSWSRRQKAVLWAFEGSYGADGRPLLASPVEIRVRLDDTPRTMGGQNGQPIAVSATAIVGQVVRVQSLLWVATNQLPNSDTALSQWYLLGSAGSQTGLLEVVTDTSQTDLKNRHTTGLVGLIVFKDLP